MDIRISGGRIIDPSSGVDGVGSVAISNNRIIEDDGSKASLTLHAEGYMVVPGLVDFHTHVFEGSLFGVEPLLFVPNGVTSIVDAGSCGCAGFSLFREKVMLPSKIRMKAFLNVATIGQPGGGVTEDVDPKNFKCSEISYLVEKHRDDIIALKLRISKPIVKDIGIAALDGAIELAQKLSLPLCVHVTNPPEPMSEVVRRFRKGDIFCHVYQGAGYTIVDDDGKLCNGLEEARNRGVIFDAANGRLNFNFKVARAAIKQGFLPDIISSDATRATFNRSSGMKNLPFILSKYLNMGLDLTCLIRAVTETPAKIMGMAGKIGTLRPGAYADVAIFKLEQHKTSFTDSQGEVLEGCVLLVPKVTILNGQVLYCANDFDID